jgi:carbonic anhydrase
VFKMAANNYTYRSLKPSPEEILKKLEAGNKRFYERKSIHPNIDPGRLQLAAQEDQGDYAYATIISCSDSRVPVELIFDTGVMDLFVIRVAGNICGPDQCGSIEFGLLTVKTPVLVVMGHTHCGAVTAAVQMFQNEEVELGKNFIPIIDRITPSVTRVVNQHPTSTGDEIISHAIEANVHRCLDDLLNQSPDTRNLVEEGKVIAIGAVYDIGTGKIKWLPISI